MVCYDKDMTIEADTIITVNAGSSSIKVGVFTRDESSAQVSRLVDISLNNVGYPSSTLQIVQLNGTTRAEDVQIPDHATGARLITEKLTDFVHMGRVLAVGHRLVHGGIKYTNATHVEDITERDWQNLEQLDTKHTPAAHCLVNHFTRYTPAALQIACFDTSFFQDLPHIARIVPIPKKYYAMGVRRYGFHGLSYTSLLGTFREKAGDVAADGRVIMAHLGSGASVTAMRYGKPLDTTMGFTPTSGLVMSTRSGDLDPNVFGFLHRQGNMSLEEFDQMVSGESGLLGVSGSSGDMHKLLSMEGEDEDARLAIELFVQSVKKSIGALSAVLGGVDSIIFSGGIGEQSSALRARICQGLEYLGIEISEVMNKQSDFLISSSQSKAGVHVIPTDEARVIAAQTIKFLSEPGKV